MGRLSGKVAYISGSGAGIGAAAAKLFAAEGARVTIVDRDRETGERTLKAVRDAGGQAIFVPTDVGNEEAVKAAMDRTIAEFGRLDVVYNNVGGTQPDDGTVTEIAGDAFWNSMRINLYGAWLGCHYGIPHLKAAGGGSVINTTSYLAFGGFGRGHAYTAAKGAIVSLTQAMAVEYAPFKIRVNAVAPGSTMTERWIRRNAEGKLSQKNTNRHLLGLVEPLDVAQAALYLASDESLRTTGSVLPVESGAIISVG